MSVFWRELIEQNVGAQQRDDRSVWVCWPRVEGAAECGSGSDDEPELLSRVETLRSHLARHITLMSFRVSSSRRRLASMRASASVASLLGAVSSCAISAAWSDALLPVMSAAAYRTPIQRHGEFNFCAYSRSSRAQTVLPWREYARSFPAYSLNTSVSP